jgi:hypothetical protein
MCFSSLRNKTSELDGEEEYTSRLSLLYVFLLRTIHQMFIDEAAYGE